MSRVTERWGPDEGSIAGHAKCYFLECPAETSCRTCHHHVVINRLAEYEDKIPYDQLDYAVKCMRAIDKNNSIGCASFTQWISVEERLPEDYVSVLVWYGDIKTIDTNFYDRFFGSWFYGAHKVTHWMPIPKPEPPEEE